MSGDKDGRNPVCDGVREDLDEYLDGELAAGRVAELEAHLASCDACAAELDRRRKLVTLVQALPKPKAPAGLAERIVAARSAGTDGSGPDDAASRPGRPKAIVKLKSWKLKTWAPVIATAAVLLLALVIGLNAPREDRFPAEMARDAETPAAPSAEGVRGFAAKAEAPSAALADAEDELDEVADAGSLVMAETAEKAPLERTAPSGPGLDRPDRAVPGVALKKGADLAVPEVAAAREAERDADPGLAGARPPADDMVRFEAKESAPAEERAVAAKSADPARRRSKAGRPMTQARSARRATGGRYEPERADAASMAATTAATDEELLGRREDFDRELAAETVRSGQAVVVPQVERIPRQAATGAEDERSRTGRVVLSGVTGSRAPVAEGGGMVATIPLATPDPMATQILIVTLARQLGGEFVKGIPAGGAAADGFALATGERKSGGAASSGQRSRPGREQSPVASNVAPFTAGPRGDRVVVRLPGIRAELLLRKIDSRFGEVETKFVTVLEEEASVDGGEQRPVYREVRKGSVLEKLPPLRELAEVTVEFPLMSLAEAEEIEAAEAVETTKAARAAKAASETLLDEAASKQTEPTAPAETQAEPAAY